MTSGTGHETRRVTLVDSLRCARLSLWDEQNGRMIRFQDLKHVPVR